jgi:hypothetical protein
MLEERPAHGRLSELSEDEFDTFIILLGKLVYRTIPVGAFARHAFPLDTVRDYYHVRDTDSKVQHAAKEFWKDLASRKLGTAELSEKWFAGKASAAAVPGGEVAKRLDQDT